MINLFQSDSADRGDDIGVDRLWRSWQEEGRSKERQRASGRLKWVKGISLGALLVAAAFWARAAEYDLVLRIVVSVGALWVTRQAISERQFRWAAAFAAIALAYNPLIPTFALNGSIAFGAVMATVLFFGASLTLLGNAEDQSARKATHGV